MALVGLVVGVCFLLGCYSMGDTDIWWHLSGGRWILQNGRVPGLDPFTFGSADRLWVDVHWLFEVVAARLYGSGGVPALVLMAAGVGTAAVTAVLTTWRREWPVAATLLVWVPALVTVSFRFDPRPEIFTLLFLGWYLAVLWRVERRPALVWLLLPAQALWANMQGLFVLGPIVLGMYLAGHAARLAGPWWRGSLPADPGRRRWWTHVGLAAVAVVAACFINPYGWHGVRFPFDLYPKVASAGNPYKEYIDELMSPQRYAAKAGVAAAGDNWYFCAFYLLLLLVPVTFLVPAAWAAWRSAPPARRDRRGRRPGTAPPPRTGAWHGVLVAVVVLCAVSTITLTSHGRPDVLVLAGWAVPAALAAAGLGGVFALARHSRQAAALALAGGLAVAAWVVWLHVALLGPASGWPAQWGAPAAAVALGAGLPAVALAVRWGADPFRLLLAGAFGYLALQALQNFGRFGLVAGAVMAWNVGEWLARLAEADPHARQPRVAWALRLGLAGLVAAWGAAIVTDRYSRWVAEGRHFDLGELPLEFAHEAVRFAGQDGMPERALVYEIGQTGLFDFHNGPGRKPYMDGRLEMPTLETFQRYVAIEDWLHRGDPRWAAAVHALGDPLLLLTHSQNAEGEAAVLAQPGWRCVYFDAIAAVFLPDADGRASAQFPAVDFAARHFGDAGGPSVPDRRGAAFRELRALYNLAVTLRRTPRATWTWRVPILWRALDRADRALAEEPGRAAAWTLLGNCHWNLVPDLTVRPPTPADPWDPVTCLAWAQATYCHRRAVELAPDDGTARRYLYEAYQARHMADAQVAVGLPLLDHPKTPPDQAKQIQELHNLVAASERLDSSLPADPAVRVDTLLRSFRPVAAAQAGEDLQRFAGAGLPWALADRVAGVCMHLGLPADARQVWELATGVPSEAARRCRVGSTYWVERDYERAVGLYREAVAADPRLTEAHWALAVLFTQRGEAGPALAACRQGLRQSPTPRHREALDALVRLLTPFAAARGGAR